MEQPAYWDELSPEQKSKVERYILTLLSQQAPLSLIEKPGREVVEQRTDDGVTYQLERVKCGKERCHKCPHGPYWYAYYRKGFGGKVVSKYVGKEFKRLDLDSF
jgi:hypothetical protein